MHAYQTVPDDFSEFYSHFPLEQNVRLFLVPLSSLISAGNFGQREGHFFLMLRLQNERDLLRFANASH